MSPQNDEFAAVLLTRGVISPEQLAEAWQLASQTGFPLRDTLIRLGYATVAEVAQARAFCAELPLLDLTALEIPPAIIEQLPESVARENVVLPIAQEGRTLTIAMSEVDLGVLEKLTFILNRDIRPVLAIPEQILDAINRYYGQYETESVDSMLAEFTDTAIDFTQTDTDSAFEISLESGDELERPSVNLEADEELVTVSPPDKSPQSQAGHRAERLPDRRATVRYYHRMNPQRMFPLLVVLSRNGIEEVVKSGVRQAQSQSFRVAEGSLVEVEPVLPGCACFPPREQVRVGSGEVSVTFWVVPEVLGQVMQARVVVRQSGETLAEVPLEMHVVRQSVTLLMGALSFILPFGLFLLKQAGLDLESQSKDGFSLYAQIAGSLVQHLTPEVLTGLLLAATIALYLWLRPRKREVFWDIKPREVASPAPALPATTETARSANAAKPQTALEYFHASLEKAQSGDLVGALAILKRAEAKLPPGQMKGPLWFNMGCFSARLGRFPEAVHYLNRAVDAGFEDPQKYRTDPDLEPLRWHGGFRRLLKELELAR